MVRRSPKQARCLQQPRLAHLPEASRSIVVSNSSGAHDMRCDLPTLARRVLERSSAGRALVVGIDGRSGVGKSTAAQWLADKTGGIVIDGDSFFAGGVGIRSESPQVRSDMCIDRPKLSGVLEGLRSRRIVSYRPFDWDAFDGSLSPQEIRIVSSSIYILDGVYSCHPDLDDLVDLRTCAYVSDQTRMNRLLEREGQIGPWERQWHEAEEWYFRYVMPLQRFHLSLELEGDTEG